MKKRVSIILLLAIVFWFGFVATALTLDEKSTRAGKLLYRKHCRTCHRADGDAGYMGPDSKTMAQWKRIFTEEYKEIKCKEEWEKRTKEEIDAIFAFLYEHALDSPSPAKCK